MRVCNLCFTLVEKESQLIGIEKKLVEIQGISIAPEQNIAVAERPVLLEKDLHQYRIMFYFIKMVGDIMKLKPTEEGAIKIEIKLFDAATVYPLLFSYKVKEGSQIFSARASYKSVNMQYTNCAKLNFLRFYYFYSLSPNISDFLKRAQLEVSIYEESYMKSKKLLGRSFVTALEDFIMCDSKEITRVGFATRHTLGLKFFLKESNSYYDMPIIAGIAYDGVRDTSHISLKKYEDIQAYYPPNDFFTSDLIPSEWMEIFDEGMEASKVNVYRALDSYEPNVSQNEYDLNLPKGKRNFHIQRARTEKYIIDSGSNTIDDRKVTVKNITNVSKNDGSNCSASDDFKIYRSLTKPLNPKNGASPLMNVLFMKHQI